MKTLILSEKSQICHVRISIDIWKPWAWS